MSGFIDDTDGISFSEIRQAFNSIYVDNKTGSIRLSDFVGETTTDSVDNILTIPRNNLSLRQYFKNRSWIPELLYTLRDTDGTNDRFTFRNKNDVFATTGDSLSEVRSRLNIDANSSTLSSDERWWNDNDYFKMATKSVDGVTETMNGYQVWTVPKTGYYRITALGAMGGGSYETITEGVNPNNVGGGSGSDYCYGGYSVEMSGVYRLLAGEKLLIIVGKKGEDYPWPRSSGNVTELYAGVNNAYYGRSKNSFYEDPVSNPYAHNMTQNDKIYGAGGGGGGSFVFMYDESTGVNGISSDINSATIIVSGGGGGGSKMEYRDFINNQNSSINDFPLVSDVLVTQDTSDNNIIPVFENSEFFHLSCASPVKYHPLKETDENGSWITDWNNVTRGTDHKGISDHGYGLGGKSILDSNVILDINGKSETPSGHTNAVLGTRGGFGGGGNSTLVDSMNVGQHKYWEWQNNEHQPLRWVSLDPGTVGGGGGATAEQSLESYKSIIQSDHPYTGNPTTVNIINPGQSSGGGGGGWIGGMGGKGREYGKTTQWSKQDSPGNDPIRSTALKDSIYALLEANPVANYIGGYHSEILIRQVGVGIHDCSQITTSLSNLYIYNGSLLYSKDANGETLIPPEYRGGEQSTFGFSIYNTNYGRSVGVKMQYRESTHNRNGWGGGSYHNESLYVGDNSITSNSANNRLHNDYNNSTSSNRFKVKGTKTFKGKNSSLGLEPQNITVSSLGINDYLEFDATEKNQMRLNGSGRVVIEFISV